MSAEPGIFSAAGLWIATPAVGDVPPCPQLTLPVIVWSPDVPFAEASGLPAAN